MIKTINLKKKETDYVYSDDEWDNSKTEKFLLDFFDKPQSKKNEEIEALLAEGQSWPKIVHLSPERHALLNWYDFEQDASLLEIGGGLGALSHIFLEKVKNVTINELSEIRAEVIKKRFSDKKFELVIGDIRKYEAEEKFDYITLIGVLEYVALSDSEADYINSYVNFLESVSKMLKKGGKILIAIENKIGMKYLTGGKEDHIEDKYFSSIEEYPNFKKEKVRTFSKIRIRECNYRCWFFKN
ncbi:MAG: class I SAM-dependent methyltransferase [Candidatus Dojkabacteria bacterium]|nr:class I SAM-dependent methyltransferase [Candidatus Dojkabacteria bacterium]